MDNNMMSILYAVLVFLIFLVIALAVVFVMLKAKEKKEESQPSEEKELTKSETKEKGKTRVAKEYEPKSIFDFMEFENVKDNMIIQKKGRKFLMAIECQGVNYDLMSDVEKASTEQGFSAFLNTLREPIQIYIQTRTVNLEKNIMSYKERVGKIRDDLNLKEYKLKQYLEQDNQDEKELKNKRFEVLRQTNLYDYGRDVIADTERMSSNKNVLKKKYYIILKYFYEPIDGEEGVVLDDEEISEIAFSNLYTKATSMVRALSGIGIVGRALNSFELVDLLYNAYNRDDSEVFGIEKAIDAGYNEIYIDAQSSIEKKIQALNKEIEMKAKESVKEAMQEIEDEKNAELKEIEDNLDDIIVELAKNLINDETTGIPESVKEKAKEKVTNNIKKVKKGEKKANGEIKTKETARRSKAG